ncbi:MAG: hypothetical protein H0U41_06515, partial [Actinobacteria bacterium]|nr:hypothetical protein [Actinomycetota bacterium]
MRRTAAGSAAPLHVPHTYLGSRRVMLVLGLLVAALNVAGVVGAVQLGRGDEVGEGRTAVTPDLLANIAAIR